MARINYSHEASSVPLMRIKVDDEYLHRSVRQPDADKVKGFENIPMPPQNVTDEELEELIAWIKQLK